VGAIRVARDRTYFEVAANAAADFAVNAAERDPRAPHVTIEPAEGELPARSLPAAVTGKGPARPTGKPPARNRPPGRAPLSEDRPVPRRAPQRKPANHR
jgi:hypothetical protein